MREFAPPCAPRLLTHGSRLPVSLRAYPGSTVNTNDAFVGIDSETLVKYGVSKSYPPAFDAGGYLIIVSRNIRCTAVEASGHAARPGRRVPRPCVCRRSV